MAWDAIRMKLTGAAPMLMHNGQLANPMNPIVKAIKAITSKKRKTDAELTEIARLEFLGGLYLDKNGHVCVTGNMIEGVIVSGAKKKRMGPIFQAAMMCPGTWPLCYEGPRTAEELWEMPEFRNIQGVTVDRKRIYRCRPIFTDWSVTVDVQYDDEAINREQVVEAAETGGKYAGLGDYLPRYGRFDVQLL